MKSAWQSWVQRQQARFSFRRGVNLARQENLSGAIAAFTDALANHLKPEEIYLKRGIIHWRKENAQAALADFNQAIALSPYDPRAYGNRGLVRYHLGDVEGALADWAIALHYRPEDPTVRYNRGLLYTQQGKPESALADFDIALRKNPLLAEAYLHRGRIKHDLGDLAGAVKDWELALCNDLRLEEAHTRLMKLRHASQDATLTRQIAAVLPPGFTLKIEQRHDLLILTLHRPLGAPVNYFKLPNVLRETLISLQIPEARKFRLLAQAGDSTLAEWDQTYGIYDRIPCPPTHWRAALATTLLLFPPFGILALVYAVQVRQAYKQGDYPIAVRASQAAKKLCLSSGALMGLMLFLLAGYGVYTHVEVKYPNPSAKTALLPKALPAEEKL
jgi:tetratricopeptide (TPR) repeat protein